MRALNLRFASVDIVRLDDEGKDLRVLEVNGCDDGKLQAASRDDALCAKIYEDAMMKCTDS